MTLPPTVPGTYHFVQADPALPLHRVERRSITPSGLSPSVSCLDTHTSVIRVAPGQPRVGWEEHEPATLEYGM